MDMKSKKAETYLNRVYKGDWKVKAYNREVTDKAIHLAQEEAKEKAKQAFLKAIEGKFLVCGKSMLHKFMEELDK